MTKIREEQVKGSEFKLIAEYNGEYAGELVYDLFVFDAKCANISDLEIVAQLRKKGIATELMKVAIERIFARPYMQRIVIQDGSDKAITSRIAQKLGFKLTNNEYPFWLELRRHVAQSVRALA